MSSTTTRSHESVMNTIWQRNLSCARNIHIDLNNLLSDFSETLKEVLKQYCRLNDTDEMGLFLSLLTCMGHFSGKSTVSITNHVSNLNLFTLLIGPSGCGKSKIISPIKNSVYEALRALSIAKEKAGIMDDFTTATLSSRLSKSNVLVVTDEAEKPLMTLGFYSPMSEATAADRIAGCKFFGTVPTTKDTMNYHLEIESHLSFVGATTGRLWPRLISYYSQGYQSDGFSERFIHYAMPKKTNFVIEVPCSIEIDDDDDDSDRDDDLSDEEMELNSKEPVNEFLPSLAQMLIIVHLLGERHYTLSQYGTKKFLKKIREMQELSQVDKLNDVNYGSRIGKSTEILCKISGLAQLLQTTMHILETLANRKQLRNDDISQQFVRNAALLIENLYPNTEAQKMEINRKSCRFAALIMCNNLMKMLFTIYNIDPMTETEKHSTSSSLSIQSTSKLIRSRILNHLQLFFLKRELTGTMGLLRHHPADIVNAILEELVNHELLYQGAYIASTSRAIIHMKALPSMEIMNDPVKGRLVHDALQDSNLSWDTYVRMITHDSTVKKLQRLTLEGYLVLQKPQYTGLLQRLQENHRTFFEKINLFEQNIGSDILIETNSDSVSNETTIQSHLIQGAQANFSTTRSVNSTLKDKATSSKRHIQSDGSNTDISLPKHRRIKYKSKLHINDNDTNDIQCNHTKKDTNSITSASSSSTTIDSEIIIAHNKQRYFKTHNSSTTILETMSTNASSIEIINDDFDSNIVRYIETMSVIKSIIDQVVRIEK